MKNLLKPLSEVLQYDALLLHADLTFTRWAAASVKRSVREHFLPLEILGKMLGVGRKTMGPTIERIQPTAAALIDDVASQHAGNGGGAVEWAQKITYGASQGIQR